jgi:hypothetical protein
LKINFEIGSSKYPWMVGNSEVIPSATPNQAAPDALIRIVPEKSDYRQLALVPGQRHFF